MAAAQASAFPMKVGPCISACMGSSDQNASKTFRLATVAASGSVAAGQRLRQRDDVGHDTAAASQANSAPVRPKPVKISSKTKRRS